jgi:hypothetical protein
VRFRHRLKSRQVARHSWRRPYLGIGSTSYGFLKDTSPLVSLSPGFASGRFLCSARHWAARNTKIRTMEARYGR